MKWACLVLVFVIIGVVKAVPFNKYGRTCKDISCVKELGEVCEEKTDVCTTYSRDKCGKYPTCVKTGVKKGCSSISCPARTHFCTLKQESCTRPPCQITPTCIAFRTRETTPTPSAVVRPSYSGYNGGYGQRSSTGQRTSWSWGSG